MTHLPNLRAVLAPLVEKARPLRLPRYSQIADAVTAEHVEQAGAALAWVGVHGRRR